MPTEYTTPGVYAEEIPKGLQAIPLVATSIAAFVGRTRTGPIVAPTLITSFAEFERNFGGLSVDSPLSYAVRQFYDNGGKEAWIARIVHEGDEAAALTDGDLAASALESVHRGLWSLEAVESFNLLCIPPLSPTTDVGRSTWNAAIAYARRRRAFVIVDPPAGWTTVADAIAGLDALVVRDANAALYFPRINVPDPLDGGVEREFAPSGAIAGVYARTDLGRGLWKAPAGPEAVLTGVTGLTAAVDSQANDALAQAGINALRQLPSEGPVVWGARTLAGGDSQDPEWKYIPVRRLALCIEESIVRATRWVTFEPNGDPLWAQLVWQVDAFLHTLWTQGAFQGTAPRSAYFVKCDSTTMTPADIAAGRLVLLVGFAALKPAEFSILRFVLRTAKVPGAPPR